MYYLSSNQNTTAGKTRGDEHIVASGGEPWKCTNIKGQKS